MIDHLTDTWRWWASGGAAVGIAPLAIWVWAMTHQHRIPNANKTARAVGGLAMMAFLLAILIAGAIIPLANEGRLEGFNQQSPSFRQSMALVWLMFGAGTWGVAISFSRSPKMMAVVCVAWWWAMAFATIATVGAAA